MTTNNKDGAIILSNKAETKTEALPKQNDNDKSCDFIQKIFIHLSEVFILELKNREFFRRDFEICGNLIFII